MILLGVGAFLLLSGNNPKDKEVEENEEDFDFDVDQDKKPSFICLVEKWQSLRDCADKKHMSEAVKQIDDLWPVLNKKEEF